MPDITLVVAPLEPIYVKCRLYLVPDLLDILRVIALQQLRRFAKSATPHPGSPDPRRGGHLAPTGHTLVRCPPTGTDTPGFAPLRRLSFAVGKNGDGAEIKYGVILVIFIAQPPSTSPQGYPKTFALDAQGIIRNSSP